MSAEDGDEATNTPSEVCTNIQHVQQRYSWDCGLASAQMIISYFGKSLERFQENCSNLNFGTSVWTIDLAYLLHCYGIDFTYTTTTLGVDKGYSKKVFGAVYKLADNRGALYIRSYGMVTMVTNFYKDKFTSDEARVNAMFEQAYAKQIAIDKRSVTLKDIADHLCEQKVVLLLIDWNYLRCKWCNSKCLPSLNCIGRCLGTYQGHYIVLCGYNRKERLFYYKNPALKKELCCCSHKTLEAARKSYGTDEDCIFVNGTPLSTSVPS